MGTTMAIETAQASRPRGVVEERAHAEQFWDGASCMEQRPHDEHVQTGTVASFQKACYKRRAKVSLGV